MKFYVTTEATSDFPESLNTFENFRIFPMGYTLNGEIYDGDTTKLTPSEFYNAVKNAKTKEDLPITTMVTTYVAKEELYPILKQGYDVLHIGFSHNLSGTFDAIYLAIKELREEFPDRKIEIVDSNNASFGEGMLAYYTLLKRDSGATIEETTAYAQSMVDKCCAYFMVDDIKHLYRTGRASKASAMAGEMLQIKPILYVNKFGKLVPIKKVMSKKKGIRELFNYMNDRMLPNDEQTLYAIGHGNCPNDAETLKNMITEAYPDKPVQIFDIGPVIGTHTGSGIIAVFFLGNTREEHNDTCLNDEK